MGGCYYNILNSTNVVNLRIVTNRDSTILSNKENDICERQVNENRC